MTKQVRMTNDETARDVPRSPEECDVREYRVRKYYLWIGAVGTAASFLFGIGSFIAAWWNLDGSFRHPQATAIVFAVFWSFFVALGAWILLAYFRERLVISTDRFTQTSVFRKRWMRHDDVTIAKWRLIYGRGGSLVLRGRGAKIVIHFDNFTEPEQEELRTIFRRLLPENVQENWERYAGVTLRPIEPRKARRNCYLLAAVCLAFSISFVTGAFLGVGNLPQFIILAVLNALAAAWLFKKAQTVELSIESDT